MTRVLVPYDGSLLADRALEFAFEKFPEAEITALHVVDTTVAFQPERFVGANSREVYEQREREGRDLLEAATETADEHGVVLETTLEFGQPHAVILDYADEHDVDHIVMGSHGRSALERFFVGSVADRVVNRVPVPVTVIR